jgi:hypothetical protein
VWHTTSFGLAAAGRLLAWFVVLRHDEMDQLAQAIGYVALADVSLERSLRTLATVLSVAAMFAGVQDGPAAHRFGRDIPQLVDFCRRQLPARAPRRAGSGGMLLNEASDLHALRNRFVHDEWLPERVDDVSEPRLSTARYEPNKALPTTVTARTIEEVDEVAARLRVCAARLDLVAYYVTLDNPIGPNRA